MFRIAPWWSLHAHGWCGRPALPKYFGEIEPHLGVYAGSQECFVDSAKQARPKREPRAERKKRNPGRLLEGQNSARTNQLKQGSQDRNGIGEKHQDETADGRVEGFVANDLGYIGLSEGDVA